MDVCDLDKVSSPAIIHYLRREKKNKKIKHLQRANGRWKVYLLQNCLWWWLESYSFNCAGTAMQIRGGGRTSETPRPRRLLILLACDTLQSVLKEKPWDVSSCRWVPFVWAPVICLLCRQLLCSAVSVLELTFTIDSTGRALVLLGLQDTEVVL